MEAKNEITLVVNQERAVNFAQTVVKLAESVPMKERLTMINGIALSLVYAAEQLKCEQQEDSDKLERLVLFWLKSVDEASGLNFGKYINDFSTEGLLKVERK